MKKKQVVALLLTCGMISSPFNVFASPTSGVIAKFGNVLEQVHIGTPAISVPKTKYTTTRVNVRRRSTTDSRIIKTLDIAEKVKVYYTEDGWSKVDKGWIKSEYLSKDKPKDKLLVTEEERYWLYQLVEAEAGCESEECRAYITSVAFNLMGLPETPDNIKDVIFYRNLFSPTLDGRIYSVSPSESTKRVVDSILRNGVCTDALFFEASYCHSSWHGRQTKIRQIDHTIFYK